MSIIASPDFAQVRNETGDFTRDAIQALWLILNQEIADRQREVQISKNRLEPLVKTSAPTGATDNLSLEGASVLHFTGGTAFNLTGLVAPETNKARVIVLHNSGTGTITLKHEVTSTAGNRLHLITGADTTIATDQSAIFVYLSSRWRQVK